MLDTTASEATIHAKDPRAVPTQSSIILYNHLPIGYIQTYWIADYPDYCDCLQLDEDVVGIDLFIGETDYLHKGLE